MARYTISHQPGGDYWHVRDNSQEVDETVASFTNEEQALLHAANLNEMHESLYGQAYDFIMRLDDRYPEEFKEVAMKFRRIANEGFKSNPNDQWSRVATKVAEIMDIMQEEDWK